LSKRQGAEAFPFHAFCDGPRTDCALHTQEAPPARHFTTTSRNLMLQCSIFIKLGLLNSPWRSLPGPGSRATNGAGEKRLIWRNGAWGRIRTTDTRIFNPLLYQLSYPGLGPARAGAASIKEPLREVQRGGRPNFQAR